MQYFRILVLSVICTITGCVSSSDFEKQAEYHDKAADYYKSIGQPGAAREEYESAKKNRDDANDPSSILADLFDILIEEKK